VRVYSEALQHASGDALACTTLVLNRSAAHAGLRQWHESLADADTVLHGARHPATGSVPACLLTSASKVRNLLGGSVVTWQQSQACALCASTGCARSLAAII